MAWRNSERESSWATKQPTVKLRVLLLDSLSLSLTEEMTLWKLGMGNTECFIKTTHVNVCEELGVGLIKQKLNIKTTEPH